MNLNDLNLHPDQNLRILDEGKFIVLFDSIVSKLCRYKGIKYDENLFAKMFSDLYEYTHNINNLTLNDVTAGIERMVQFEDIKKISVQLLHRRMQRISIEKTNMVEEQQEADYSKSLDNGYFGRAMSLRMIHDKGGKILDKEGHTIKDVMECVKSGHCYYTGKPITIDKPETNK